MPLGLVSQSPAWADVLSVWGTRQREGGGAVFKGDVLGTVLAASRCSCLLPWHSCGLSLWF